MTEIVEVPGAKFVEVVNDVGRPPKLRCKKHMRFILTYVLRVGRVDRPVCMECLAETGIQIDRAVCGRGSLSSQRLIPRIPGTALVVPGPRFICKWCTTDYNTYYELQDHYQDCDIRSMVLRPAST